MEAQLNGIRLAWDEAGTPGATPAIIFVHGFPLSRASWRPQLAALADATATTVIFMGKRTFGELAGIAFQIKDDIFDYQEKGIIGKPTGNDIKEKKITLPLLYLLNHSTRGERLRILRLIKRKNTNSDAVRELVDLVVEKGGVEYATQQMNHFREKAIHALMEFPQNEARTSLIALMNYITERKK